MNVAHGVAGDERTNGYAVEANACAGSTAFHGACRAIKLAHGSACACADIACLGAWVAAGGHAGAVAAVCIGANARVAHGQIKQHCGRNQWQLAVTGIQADMLLFQPAHHAIGCGKTPGAAASEQYGVHFFNQIAGAQQIGFACAGGCTTNIYGGRGRFARDDDAAARGALWMAVVPHFNALHAGDAVHLSGLMMGFWK